MAGSARSIVRRFASPVLGRLDARAAHQARVVADEEGLHNPPPPPPPPEPEPEPATRVYVPRIDWNLTDPADPFMQYAACSAADFLHPAYSTICEQIDETPRFHRKQWEFVYVMHHLTQAGVLRPGSRGLGFGVGSEPLAAAFAAAGCEIVATDAPPDVGVDGGWQQSSQHALSVDELRNDGICDPDLFRNAVTYRTADMNHIDPDLRDFDFCWSACCFEHLGSIQHGLDFVVASVEDCLRPGGVAVHTTEFNLTSDDETLESPHLSIYRRRDLVDLADRLRSLGHEVSAITIAPDGHYLDQVVDLPPYISDAHLKLELAGYVTTSVGLVIRKHA